MDVVKCLTTSPDKQPIQCVDMHTTGEPTRIVISGYPNLSGTLLEQRADALAKHDHIRKRLMWEPRGHNDMYGAVLRPKTELVESGAAHMGVLFLTNVEYSTMCGHATIALGRFLFDTQDLTVFPKRHEVKVDQASLTAEINLHPPCGLVQITVPVTSDGQKSDPTRPVSFIDVPSFATGLNIEVHLPPSRTWPELHGRTTVTADFSYGGAFYCMISATELGFNNGLHSFDPEAMNRATRSLKAAINADPRYHHLFRHPEHDDLGFLYSIIVVDPSLGQASPGIPSTNVETGLCYFSDQQIDRSPTGSGVAARVALAVAKGQQDVGHTWTYHSLVSNAFGGNGGFDSEVVSVRGLQGGFPIVDVRVSGRAFYVGVSSFVVEGEDGLSGGGFLFGKLGGQSEDGTT